MSHLLHASRLQTVANVLQTVANVHFKSFRKKKTGNN